MYSNLYNVLILHLPFLPSKRDGYLAQCELLVLVDNDFNSILKPYMQKVWNDKKAALKALDYFDFLSEDQVSELHFNIFKQYLIKLFIIDFESMQVMYA